MIVRHRGHTITASRICVLDGNMLSMFLTIVRDSDGYLCLGNSYVGGETVREVVQHMRGRIDAVLFEDAPWGEMQNL